MSIRNAAKAIIVRDQKILLNTCFAPNMGEYYALPGGGQHPYESMEQAIIRECLEETGYRVIPEAFVALYEEIFTQESIQNKYPNHAHKILHIFRCRVEGVAQTAPSELDSWQRGSTWIDIADIPSITLRPACVGEHLAMLIEIGMPVYLGSHFTDYQEKA